MNQGGRRVEGGIPYQEGTVRADGDVLRVNELSSNLPSLHERDIQGPHPRGGRKGLHGRHTGVYRYSKGTSRSQQEGVPDPTRKQAVSEGGQVRIREGRGGIPWGDRWKWPSTDGSQKGSGDHGLASTKEEKGHTGIPQILQLLSPIYQGFQEDHQTLDKPNRKQGISVGCSTTISL